MRRVMYALTAAGALLLGALSTASAGCYGECNGYYEGGPTYYSNGPDYGPRGHTVYYERGPEIFLGGYERPLYRPSAYVADYNGDGYADTAYVGGGGYYGGYGYRGYGYRGYGYGYRGVAGCGPYGCGVAGCGPYGCGVAYRGYGYGYPRYGYYGSYYGGYGYRRSAPYGYGAYMQTAGYGGCRTAYVPYGWSWYRGTNC